jgi:hypothetical protein
MDNTEKNIITKRIQTTMIGAIFEFEQNFGYLWGQDKDDDAITPQEEKFRDRWENTRNEILNKGNNQLRKCLSDLEKTQNNNIKYNYNFKKGYKKYED